jgi:hypothetical protein
VTVDMSPLLAGALQYVPHHEASDRTGDRKEQHGEPEIAVHQEATERMRDGYDYCPDSRNDDPTGHVRGDPGIAATNRVTKDRPTDAPRQRNDRRECHHRNDKSDLY